MKRRLRAVCALLGAGAIVVLSLPISAAQAATTGSTQTYLVVYKDGASSQGAAAAVRSAGGTFVFNYQQIGVVIARSNRTDFRDRLLVSSSIEGVSATAPFATGLQGGSLETEADGGPAPTPPKPAPGMDNLSGLQWDMTQIHAFEAHATNGGSSSVIVGDLDTGLDFTHPDLAPNVDFANSVSCESGVPDQNPAAWMDKNGHGTHTAGTIAAAKNTIGIVGVAPNVKIAGVKTSNDDGFFFPEMVVCAFVWAGEHHFNVTNNSYFADPWLFNCKNDPGQRAIWKAEQRAILFAQSKGVVVVAAAGNENIDLAHRNVDEISPDFPPDSSITRDVNNNCVVIPVEIPGVIGVSGDGNLMQKAYFSTYGVGAVQVVAPSGDRRFQVTAAAVNGRVLSSWPSSLAADCPDSLRVTDGAAVYCYLQGTSMASPHVAGVAALIASMGATSPGAVMARIDNTADPMACPPNPFNPGPPFIFQAFCTGGPGYNSFFGHGQVNALSAVS